MGYRVKQVETPTTRKRNVAIMVPTLSHSVEYNFGLGVRAGLPESQFNLLYMSVGWIEDQYKDLGYASRLHNAIDFEDLDGIIIYGAGITNRTLPKSIHEITHCYPEIPIINAGNIVHDLPCVVFDNRTPFRHFVKHLVEVKDCQRIAFVNGPVGNYDAQERRAGFLEGLNAYGLTLEPQLDWPGQFGIGSGSFAVQQFLQKSKQIPDAIVCANDLTAMGVVNELLDQGYKVPEHVKVIGFDDLEYSKQSKVPLSTGRYPIFTMGRVASEEMIEWLAGRKPEPVVEVETSVIFRQSTGDLGDPRSQIALNVDSDRSYFSRDSNSDRLLLSRAINRSESILTILKQISSLIYDVGGRQLLYYQFDSESKRLTRRLSMVGDKVEVQDASSVPLPKLNLNALFQSVGGEGVNWVISPVGVEQYFFGFLLIEVLPNESDFCEYLANELSKRSENILLTRDSEDLKTQVLKTEQMATLGRLVSGLAHEINTPLGVSLVAATNLADEVGKIRTLDKNQKMTKTTFYEFLDSCEETQQILFNSLKRTADLVTSFKKVSVDQQIEELSLVNLGEYLNEVLISLRPEIRHSNVELVTEFEKNLTIRTHAGTWAQVLTNLLLNALIHGFEDEKNSAQIKLSLAKVNNTVQFEVSDNGTGIPQEKLRFIFDPFFTTRRAKGGTGLGLHIVYNMVTQKLMGQIQVTSSTLSESSKHGTRFMVIVPIIDSL